MGDALPPYATIDPARAAAALGPMVGTGRFRLAAEICARGRAELEARGHGRPEDRPEEGPGNGAGDGRPAGRRLRRFSTWEVTRYLIPVAPGHFRRVLKANPSLPQGMAGAGGGTGGGTGGAQGGMKWFTLEEVGILRAHFAREGRGRSYRPWRPAGLPAKVVAVANFKGGVGKTSTAAHLAMSAALDGYRVLVVDLDSQGSMTSIFGGRVEDEWDTVFPLIARDYAESLQAENRARMQRGEGPLPLDEVLAEALKRDAAGVIRRTHWPNIDLIGAQLNLYWAEFQIPVWRLALRGWKLWDALKRAFERDRLLERYDIVILDTPPALGYLTINGLAAADILLVPMGASFLEFDSTGRFFDMLHATFASIEAGENQAARALGLPETEFSWDAVRVIITRFDAAQQAELANLVQAWFGNLASPFRQELTALVGQAGEQVAGIYEADYRDFNRDTYARGRAAFDRTWAEVKALVIGAWKRDSSGGDRSGSDRSGSDRPGGADVSRAKRPARDQNGRD
jgi:chromosome partitioning protein